MTYIRRNEWFRRVDAFQEVRHKCAKEEAIAKEMREKIREEVRDAILSGSCHVQILPPQKSRKGL